MNLKQLKKSLLAVTGLGMLILPNVVSAESYTVKSGDTLSKIAESFGTTVKNIALANKISNVNFIKTGQVLEISGGTTSTSAVDTILTTESNSEVVTAVPTLSQSESEAKEIIAHRESSGSYTAQNGRYYGRYQLTISYLNGDLSPENQERVADAYVKGRYGSWTAALAFWNANGWY